jgi:hypothetical protein
VGLALMFLLPFPIFAPFLVNYKDENTGISGTNQKNDGINNKKEKKETHFFDW